MSWNFKKSAVRADFLKLRDLGKKTFERSRLFLGKCRQYLSVHSNAFFLEAADEFAVSEAVLTESGVDFHVPKPAKVTFFVAAVGKSISTGVENCFLGRPFFFGACETIALNFAEDVSSGFQCINSLFYS
jgi:hypothetical protein